MVVLELELDEAEAATLEREADQFEFESTTAYLHWLVRNRSVVFTQPDDALRERLTAIERRLDELEAAEQSEPEPEPEPESESESESEAERDSEVMEAVDELFDETTGADDEEISEAIESIDLDDQAD